MINIERFNLEEFFGCVETTNTPQMKSNTFKTIRTWLQEKSFAKWSDGQLEYVGDIKDGTDFVSTCGVSYEMKGSLGLFNKNGSTKTIILKNFYGENKVIKKTFEYMFLVDTANMSIGFTDWNTVENRVYFTDKSALAKVKFLPGDFEILAKNVKPIKKNITVSEIFNLFQDIL